MYCKKCGTLLREERNFCSNCGSNVGANNDDAKNNINVNMAILNNEKKKETLDYML